MATLSAVVRIGIVEGEFHWHKHDEDRTIELEQNQGVTISKGVMHRPKASQRVVMLMVESTGIIPTGD